MMNSWSPIPPGIFDTGVFFLMESWWNPDCQRTNHLVWNLYVARTCYSGWAHDEILITSLSIIPPEIGSTAVLYPMELLNPDCQLINIPIRNLEQGCACLEGNMMEPWLPIEQQSVASCSPGVIYSMESWWNPDSQLIGNPTWSLWHGRVMLDEIMMRYLMPAW